MDFNAIRERVALLIKEVKVIMDEHPAEVPIEIQTEVRAKMDEISELRTQIAEAEKVEALRTEADEVYDHFWGGTGPKTQDPEPPASDWKNVGEFLQKTHSFRMGHGLDPRLKKQLVEGTGALGGFLVPVEFEATLLQIMGEGAIVEPRALVIPMARRQLDIPALDYATIATPTGQTNFFGGAVFEWTEEAEGKPEIEVKFRQKTLVAHDLTGYLPVSDNLLADAAISLPPLFNRIFGDGSRWYRDYAYLQGSGVGQPRGVIGAPATIVVPRAAAGAVGYQDLVNLDAQLLPGANPIWVMTLSVKPSLRTMQDPAGNYIWPAFGGAAAAGMANQVLGYPIVWTEKLTGLGNPGDVMLADFSYYVIGQRGGITIASSEHYLFRHNQTAFKVVNRLDGNPWLNAPIPTQEGTTVSPFLILGDTS